MNLLDLAERAIYMTKQASGEEALPTAFGNHGYGLVNPDPSQAKMSVMGEMRSAANRQNFLDGQIQGTNLIDYKGAISERYQTISQAINNVPMAQPQQKMASNYEDFAHEMQNKMVEVEGHHMPLFDDVIPTDPELYNQIIANALQKTANEVYATIPALIENGLVPQELVPYLIQ